MSTDHIAILDISWDGVVGVDETARPDRNSNWYRSKRRPIGWTKDDEIKLRFSSWGKGDFKLTN
jgi:hypothetical protein